jgi:hypothetical protein
MLKLVKQLGYGLARVGGGLVIVGCLAYGFSVGVFEGMLQIALIIYIWNRALINKLFREYLPSRRNVKMTRLDEIINGGR